MIRTERRYTDKQVTVEVIALAAKSYTKHEGNSRAILGETLSILRDLPDTYPGVTTQQELLARDVMGSVLTYIAGSKPQSEENVMMAAGRFQGMLLAMCFPVLN